MAIGKNKNKHGVYKTGSLKQQTLGAVAPAPGSFHYVQVKGEGEALYYNKNGYLTTDFDDATAFSENTAIEIVKHLKGNGYAGARLFDDSRKPGTPVVKLQSKCKLTNIRSIYVKKCTD